MPRSDAAGPSVANRRRAAASTAARTCSGPRGRFSILTRLAACITLRIAKLYTRVSSWPQGGEPEGRPDAVGGIDPERGQQVGAWKRMTCLAAVIAVCAATGVACG